MSGKAFAIENAGKEFIVPHAYLPYQFPQPSVHDVFYAQVVGYFNHVTADDDYVILEFDGQKYRDLCWENHAGVTLTLPENELYDSQNQKFYAVKHNFLERISCSGDYYDTPEKWNKPVVIPRLYTSKCVLCKKPARKYVCSDEHCRSRRKVKKALNIKYHKVNVLSCDRNVNHVICNKHISHVRWYVQKDGIFKLECENGHITYRYMNTFKVNDVILFSLSGNSSDRIWDGKAWQTY